MKLKALFFIASLGLGSLVMGSEELPPQQKAQAKFVKLLRSFKGKPSAYNKKNHLINKLMKQGASFGAIAEQDRKAICEVLQQKTDIPHWGINIQYPTVAQLLVSHVKIDQPASLKFIRDCYDVSPEIIEEHVGNIVQAPRSKQEDKERKYHEYLNTLKALLDGGVITVQDVDHKGNTSLLTAVRSWVNSLSDLDKHKDQFNEFMEKVVSLLLSRGSSISHLNHEKESVMGYLDTTGQELQKDTEDMRYSKAQKKQFDDIKKLLLAAKSREDFESAKKLKLQQADQTTTTSSTTSSSQGAATRQAFKLETKTETKSD